MKDLMMTEVNELNFEKLKPYQGRSFVPEKVNLRNKEEVVILYKKLIECPVHSPQDLEKWLLDRSDLEAAVDQEGTVLYIRMTCQTDDKARAKAYQDFIENVVPAIKPLDDQLNRKYLTAVKEFNAPSERYRLYNRTIQTDIDLFVEKNVPLQTKVALLSQEYQTVTGAMTVEFQGKERTLVEMSKYLFEPDRVLRESAWRSVAERRIQDKEKIDGLFDQMLALRHEIAVNAGFKNFRDYQFLSYHRFDYTPQDCRQYHDSIEKLLVPLWKKILDKRRDEMKLAKLRPWDLDVDPLGRPPLKPFSEVSELVAGVAKMFDNTDPDLGKNFKMMNDLGLLDLANRKGKAPGGYQSTLAEVRKPFIFMNSVGVDDDIRTLLHEGGHAFHALACADEPLYAYRHGPMEFNEVASMAMELLVGNAVDVFYKPEDVKRSNIMHIEGIIQILVWVAVIDSFQHWIYENPNHTREERAQTWLSIRQRFGTDLVDWSGLEEFHKTLWHRQLHIFEVPFYYIEYGIAQLGALQLWTNAKKNKRGALAAYKKGLSLGGSRPLPELYQAAGIKFDFSEQTIAPLVRAIAREIQLI